MKTYILSLLALLFCVSCSANEPGTDPGVPEVPETPAGDQKVLVVYFSRTGTTKSLAEYIHASVESDMVEIQTVDPYPEDYDQCVAQARQELAAGHLPELSTTIENMAEYDVIMIGYPIWIGTTPPPINTLLDQYDFSGKTVVPFCTSGTSPASASYRYVRDHTAGATVTEGLQISRGTSTADRNTRTTAWLKQIGIIE